MEDSKYATWKAEEEAKDRIERLHETDKVKAETQATPANRIGNTTRDNKEDNVKRALKETRIELKLFLSLKAKTVSFNHYFTIVHNSTSLQWTYDKLRED